MKLNFLFKYAGINKNEYFSSLRKIKNDEKKKQDKIKQAYFLKKYFDKQNTYGSKRLAIYINKLNASDIKWSKYKIDSIKKFVKNNPYLFDKNFSLIPYWEIKRKKKGLSRTNRKAKTFKAPCYIKTIETTKKAICSDWSEINEINFPKNIKLLICMFFTPYNKILSCVISCNASGSNTAIGLRESIKHLKNPKDYYFHTDQGAHFLCLDTEIVLKDFDMKRSNTTNSMKTKKLTEPIFGIMKNEVIYNQKWNGSPEENLNKFINDLKEWIYHYNNKRIFFWDDKVNKTLSNKELRTYKNSSIFHSSFIELNIDKTLNF